MTLLNLLPWRVIREVIEASRPCASEVTPATEGNGCEVSEAPDVYYCPVRQKIMRGGVTNEVPGDSLMELIRTGW